MFRPGLRLLGTCEVLLLLPVLLPLRFLLSTRARALLAEVSVRSPEQQVLIVDARARNCALFRMTEFTAARAVSVRFVGGFHNFCVMRASFVSASSNVLSKSFVLVDYNAKSISRSVFLLENCIFNIIL